MGYPSNYEITVEDLSLCTGAGFIIVYLNKIITLPGLARHSNYENMHIKSNQITGII